MARLNRRRVARRRLHNYSLIRTGDVNMPMGWTNKISRRRLSVKRRSRLPLVRSSKRMKFSPKAIAHPIGFNTAKRCVTHETTNTAYGTRWHYGWEITNIPVTTTGEIDKRDRDMVDLIGFRIEWSLRNAVDQPLIIHMAVVAKKNATSFSSTNFFRGVGQDRGINFGTSLTSLEMNNNSINTDEYVVLLHKRIMLQGVNQSASFYQLEGRNYKFIKTYIPIRRQLRYDSTSLCNEPIHVCLWADGLISASGAASVPSSFFLSSRTIAIFREPK